MDAAEFFAVVLQALKACASVEAVVSAYTHYFYNVFSSE